MFLKDHIVGGKPVPDDLDGVLSGSAALRPSHWSKVFRRDNVVLQKHLEVVAGGMIRLDKTVTREVWCVGRIVGPMQKGTTPNRQYVASPLRRPLFCAGVFYVHEGEVT